MNIKDLPHVTVEQVLKLRKEAIKLEEKLRLVDLGPQWISTDETHPTDESSMYWVLFPSGDIEMMYFNEYSLEHTEYNKWQDLGNDDLSMWGTSYIKIEKPL